MFYDQSPGTTPGSPHSIYHLFLELTDRDGHSIQDSYGLRLAQAKQSISREILMPGTSTLVELHHCIQSLFGWKNMHLHKFSLPVNEFNSLIEDRTERYEVLCGSVFRFPASDSTEMHWNKYHLHPELKDFSNRTRCPVIDSYYENKWKIRRFHIVHPDAETKTLSILQKEKLAFYANVLLEHRTIAELLVPECPEKCTVDPISDVYRTMSRQKDTTEDWFLLLADSCSRISEELEALAFHNPDMLKDTETALEDLTALRRDYIRLLHAAQNPTAAPGDTVSFNEERRKIIEDIRRQLESVTSFLISYQPEVNPVFPEIIYHYDRGDEWRVRIRCINVYKTEPESLPLPGVREKHTYYGSAAVSPLEKQLDKVHHTGQPLCLTVDGLCVFEEAGGTSGFFDFLRDLKKHSRRNADEIRAMAECYGWNSRLPAPEELL